MDPKAKYTVEQVQAAMMLEMHRIERMYAELMYRCGVQRLTLHRF
jgi:hypothetical protein